MEDVSNFIWTHSVWRLLSAEVAVKPKQKPKRKQTNKQCRNCYSALFYLIHQWTRVIIGGCWCQGQLQDPRAMCRVPQLPHWCFPRFVTVNEPRSQLEGPQGLCNFGAWETQEQRARKVWPLFWKTWPDQHWRLLILIPGLWPGKFGPRSRSPGVCKNSPFSREEKAPFY